NKYLWIHSFFATFILLAGIISVLSCNRMFSSARISDNSIILSSRSATEQFKKEYIITSLDSHKSPPIYVPTGLFIQSIEFQSATNVQVTGYLWQRYSKYHNQDISKGFIFAESLETEITGSYENEEGDDIIKGWHFKTTIRKNFYYETFPFDSQSVWIRIWHEDFGKNVVLVPDTNSYDSLSSKTLPGIEKDFVLSEWNIVK